MAKQMYPENSGSLRPKTSDAGPKAMGPTTKPYSVLPLDPIMHVYMGKSYDDSRVERGILRVWQ